MEFDGSNGTVWLDEDKIRIAHKGFANFLTQGAHGEKSIPLRNITAVQFKSAGWTAGYIQFTLVGGIDRPGGVMEATKDENAVLFLKEQEAKFSKLKSEVESRIKVIHTSASQSLSNVTDDLERLAGLLEKGFLTKDEFESQKFKLLNK